MNWQRITPGHYVATGSGLSLSLVRGRKGGWLVSSPDQGLHIVPAATLAQAKVEAESWLEKRHALLRRTS